MVHDTPLAEESHEPRKTIPRAVIGSIVVLGFFLVIVSWGQTAGWGTNHSDTFASAPELPAFILGHRYWGGAWIIILIALFNSAIAVAIAATRFLYGMSRAGAMPKALMTISPRFKTPRNAIIVQTVVNVLLGLVLPFIIGVGNVYNVTGSWFTFALAFVYIMANIGLFLFYRREHRDEFSWLKHLALPAVGSAMLVIVVYYSVVPLPAWPVTLAPFVVLAWLVIGGITLAIIYRGPRGRVLALAGAAFGETPTDDAAGTPGARPAAALPEVAGEHALDNSHAEDPAGLVRSTRPVRSPAWRPSNITDPEEPS